MSKPNFIQRIIYGSVNTAYDCEITYKKNKNDKNPLELLFQDGELKDVKNSSNETIFDDNIPFFKHLAALDGDDKNLSMKDLSLLKQTFGNKKYAPIFDIFGITSVRFDESKGVENIEINGATLRINFANRKQLDKFKPSNDSKKIIKEWESLRLDAYKCPAGKWTIGWGHTKGVKPGQQITKEQAEKFLEEDMKEAAKAVRKHVKVKLSQNEFDALVSFVFNVGERNFENSTLLELVNKKDFKAASEEFNRWIFASGQKQRGLVNRRAQEQKLFLA